MARGKIDLAKHPLAGKGGGQTKRLKKMKPAKPDADYRRTWRIVEGAVRDAIAAHPEYLTQIGARNARSSITKRVTGAIQGHAEQSARGRSGEQPAPSKEIARTTEGGFWCSAVRTLCLAFRSQTSRNATNSTEAR